jgi:hypothetical protein
MKAAALAVLALGMLSVACSGNSTTTTPAATPTTTAGTDIFSSFVSIGGSTGRTFSAASAGTITITLDSVTPPTVVGIGIGIQGAVSAVCNLTKSVDATAGVTPPLSVPVDIGYYCVQVYDSGFVTKPGVAFSMTVVHP